jgi:peptidyl-prolyl cis-trans isomerase B (cyclophilin B)
VASSKNQEREAREARERLRRYNARQSVHTHQVKRRRRDNLFAIGAIVVVATIATVTQLFYFTSGPGAPTPEPSVTSVPQANVGNVPSPDLAEGRTWTGELDLNGTVLQISLDGAAAPQAVSAFIQDVQSGYLQGKTCHRLVVSPGTGLIQCGSENGDGMSTPSVYAYGPIENAPADNVYKTGVIAIARGGDDAYSNGHQFFIVFDDSTIPSDSAGGYSVIGTVTSGIEALEADIVSGGIVPTETSTTDGAPVIPTTITKVTIQ